MAANRPDAPRLGFSPSLPHKAARVESIAKINLVSDLIAWLHVRSDLGQRNHLFDESAAACLLPEARGNSPRGPPKPISPPQAIQKSARYRARRRVFERHANSVALGDFLGHP